MASIGLCNILLKFWSTISNTLMVCSHHSLCTCPKHPNYYWFHGIQTLRHHFTQYTNIISPPRTSIALSCPTIVLTKIALLMELGKSFYKTSGKCRSVVQGGPERSWSTPSRSDPHFWKFYGKCGSGWIRVDQEDQGDHNPPWWTRSGFYILLMDGQLTPPLPL